ncbi:UbiA family prenyltransferase, partial [Micromonospora sp. ATA51]|uniref:UbiA family prenyltransferase n=1 Tax=Micromonospora sp. ATA51 TaxID=2806098 RepID=UPI0035C998D4
MGPAARPRRRPAPGRRPWPASLTSPNWSGRRPRSPYPGTCWRARRRPASWTPDAALAGASVLLYWAGMAANDWADRHLDAVERPERPIPSGRVSPPAALGL